MRKLWKKKYSSDEVLKKVAELSKQEIHDKDNEYVKKMESIDEIFPIEPDQNFLEFARDFDAKKKKRDRARRMKRFSQVAAVFLVCVVVTCSVALEASDAFRVYFYSLFSNDSNGSVVLSEHELDLIGDWEDYWYPGFMPEGFNLVDAGDDSGQKILLFESSDGKKELRIIEIPLDASIGVDTGTNSIEEIKIGYYKGYLFDNKKQDCINVFWQTDDRQIAIMASRSIGMETVMQISERLKYYE